MDPQYLANKQEVENVCIEVFEDTVKHACGIDSEPSNPYSDVIRKFVQGSDAKKLDDLHSTMVEMSMTPEESFELIRDTMRIPPTSCIDVMQMFYLVHVLARTLHGRPEFDAAEVLSFINEHCLQTLLNNMVPTITAMEPELKDFVQLLP